MDAARAYLPATLRPEPMLLQRLMKLNRVTWDAVKIVPENAIIQAFIKAI
jgi:hypothetical protein